MNMITIIDRIEALITTSRKVPITQQTIVDSEKITELITQLRLSVPFDIKAASEIIHKKDRIAHQAQGDARKLVESAEHEYQSRIEQSEIVKSAQNKAEEIINDSEHRAKKIIDIADIEARTHRSEVDTYTRGSLEKLEKETLSLLETVRNGLNILSKQNS